VSVADFVQLPGQPTSGGVRTVPLGGNGWTAPHSTTLININQASDASGGSNLLSIEFDPRYTTLVSFINIGVGAAAAAAGSKIQIADDQDHNVVRYGTYEYGAITGLSNGGVTWSPPALLCSSSQMQIAGTLGFPRIDSWLDNTDGETHYLRARVYNFDKLARERTPLPILLASLPR